ncbi:MAG: HsdR family type I site-specific deoxyribonuclease [Chloroflexi bacterium]|nr:HsdR family type I site-specific deoxyribonuclease [Chloroflexota bacterium]
MTLPSECYTVQNPLIRYATETGWTYLPPEEALRLRRGETSPILWDVFIEKTQGLNPGTVDHLKAEEVAKRLLRVPPTIEGNLQAWEFLKGLKTVFVETERRERNLRLLDFENVHRNAFHVTDEFEFTNGVYTIRGDVVFLLNGIPIIVVETKAATKLEGIAEALDQVRRYHCEGPELLALMQVFGLTHLVQYYYGATWNLSHKNLFNWKEETAGRDFETLVKTFVAPERVLCVLRDFILFTRKYDELQKIILRPHQMRAVERALVRAHDPKRRRGLIWHTQGSGKTYTMITIAKRLIEKPLLENPTVLMLVDRNELETQLFGNLASTLLGQEARPVTKIGYYTQVGNVCIAESKRGLRELLESDTRGLIVSMIHKFDDIPANINTRKNIFVLVDEAHRTTGGDLGNYLMGALPNATYLGFTGTPIDKTAYGKGTFKVFGTGDPQGYLDKYTIAESIQDGTTLPLYYSLAPNELRVDRETLEREFLELTEAEGMSDIEDLNRVLDKAVNLRNMLKNRERVQRIAQYVAQHFKETVEPMGYKAFLVGVDREACCLLKEALDKYLRPDYSQVVISPAHNDPPEIARYHLSEDEEKRIRKAFVKPGELPKILIVTEKLLTGYDAPVLYCMYLDKPMRDHVLLQAIARVNRPYEDENGKHKPGGFVLDFVGIFENLEKALAFDSKEVQSVIEGLEVLQERFTQMIARGRVEYLSLMAGETADKAAEAALEGFRDDEKRQAFYRFFGELEDLYEILSPDPFLRGFMDDYERLADLYALLRSAYEGGGLINRELTRKTAYLVQEHTQAGLISESLGVYEITPQTLDQIAQSNQPDTVKVFNLLKSIGQKVEDEAAAAPYLLSIGERAEAIAEAFKQRQISTQEALKQLEELVREINEAAREQAERHISAESFAVLWMLKQAGISVAQAEAVADKMGLVFDCYPHWRTSDRQAREVRRALYGRLEQAEVKDIPAMAERIMAVVRRERA